MSTVAKCHVLRIFDLVPENVFGTRTHKGVMARRIEHQDEIGEVIDEAAGKFLLLVEAALHLAAFGDVHERALIAHDAAGVVANGSSRVQAHDGSAVLANQSDLAALNHRLTFDLVLDGLSLCRIDEDFRNPYFQQFFLGTVAQHAHQRRIDVHNGSVRRGDVDAFLERFEEFRETCFVFAECSNIAPKNGNALDFPAAHHGMRDTIEVKHRRLTLQAYLDNTFPLAALHEAWHGAFHEFGRIAAALLHEFGQRPADNLLEGRANEIRKTAVDGADLAVEIEGQQNIVERVNQIAIALLRPCNDFEELIELLVARRRLIALFQAVHEAAQFGNLRGLPPHVNPEQGNDNDEEDVRQGLEAVSE